LTFKLIFENMRYRPLRSLLSALLIAIPVTLILTIVGLSEGMIEESKQRTRSTNADIMIRPPGTSIIGFSGAPMSEKLVDWARKQPHVALATGVIIQTINGLTAVTGVNLDEYVKMSGGFDYIEGGPFRNPGDILIDDQYAAEKKVRVGGTINVLNHDWRVCGIFAHGKLARIILPMRAIQELTSNIGNISFIYVKLDNPANTDAVIASLQKQLDGYPIYSMAQYLAALSPDRLPYFNTFLKVVVGIAVVIGFAVVCLSMYMAVLQRTREIGILKSLGASRAYVLGLIVAEAVFMGIVGTAGGIVLSFASRWLIHTLVPAALTQAIVPDWWPIAGGIVLVASLLGALYPGFRAAQQDPIEALAYE
jgi:putative ABC transport system permease protein